MRPLRDIRVKKYMLTYPVAPTTARYTLCFLTRGDDVLLLHRAKPPNQGLWNGVGGKCQPGETPLQSVLREVAEETGYHLPTAYFAGVLTWRGFEIEAGGLYLFTAPAPAGEPGPCAEGTLRWHPRAWVCSAPEVVSNLHHVLPRVLAAAPPQIYHFDYQAGRIQAHYWYPLPMDFQWA